MCVKKIQEVAKASLCDSSPSGVGIAALVRGRQGSGGNVDIKSSFTDR